MLGNFPQWLTHPFLVFLSSSHSGIGGQWNRDGRMAAPTLPSLQRLVRGALLLNHGPQGSSVRWITIRTSRFDIGAGLAKC